MSDSQSVDTAGVATMPSRTNGRFPRTVSLATVPSAAGITSFLTHPPSDDGGTAATGPHPAPVEITGTVKSVPEDFIVREVMPDGSVADAEAPAPVAVATPGGSGGPDGTPAPGNGAAAYDADAPDGTGDGEFLRLVLGGGGAPDASADGSFCVGPAACDLHGRFLAEISDGTRSADVAAPGSKRRRAAPPADDEELIAVPPPRFATVGGGTPAATRGRFYRAMKAVYPLLKCNTLTAEESATMSAASVEGNGGGGGGEGATAPADGASPVPDPGRWVTISPDDTFLALAPYAADPAGALVCLARFLHAGPPDDSGADGAPGPAPSASFQLRDGLSKDGRRSVHGILQGACRRFETFTASEGGGTSIGVRWSRRGGRRRRANGGGNGAAVVMCVVEKRGVEHLACLDMLARAVGVRPADLGTAGIKDMRAVTSQFVSFRGAAPGALVAAARELAQKGVRLGPAWESSAPLCVGGHRGNRFEVTVRDVTGVVRGDGGSLSISSISSRDVEAAVCRVRRAGFMNYFGQQRVGDAGDMEDVGVRSFDVGREMLRHDFGAAINLLMRGRKGGAGGREEAPEVQRAREEWVKSEGDVDAVLAAMPRSGMTRERKVLKGIKRYGKSEPLAALRTLPFGSRIFWIHAYQSYVFNVVAGERMRTLGPRVVVGDLYLPEEADGGGGNGHVRDRVRVVSDASVAADVRLSQVVLPLPGYGVMYPKNEISNIYSTILKKDGITFNKESVAEGTAKGSYRKLTASVSRLSWEPVETGRGLTERDHEDVMVHSAKFKFELEKGSFATMMLREMFLTNFA